MTHYKLLLLLVSFFCITSLYAQKRNFLMYKDSVLGKDTLILNVEFSFGASLQKLLAGVSPQTPEHPL